MTRTVSFVVGVQWQGPWSPRPYPVTVTLTTNVGLLYHLQAVLISDKCESFLFIVVGNLDHQ